MPDEARRLLEVWLGAEGFRAGLAWLITNRADEVAWIHENTREIIPSNRQGFDELVEATNLALNIAVSNATSIEAMSVVGDASRKTQF